MMRNGIQQAPVPSAMALCAGQTPDAVLAPVAHLAHTTRAGQRCAADAAMLLAPLEW